MSANEPDQQQQASQGGQPSEEEMRAAYEQQLKSIRVEQLLLEDVVMLINVGMMRTGVMEGTAEDRDGTQAQLAVEAVRALMPLVEQVATDAAPQLKQALSQLQMAYVQSGGGGKLKTPTEEDKPDAEPKQAEQKSRLWVPGQ